MSGLGMMLAIAGLGFAMNALALVFLFYQMRKRAEQEHNLFRTALTIIEHNSEVTRSSGEALAAVSTSLAGLERQFRGMSVTPIYAN